MSEFPEPTNVTVVESPRFPPLGKMPSEMKVPTTDVLLPPVDPLPEPEEMHEADQVKADTLARAYTEGQKSLTHTKNMLKWFSVTDPDPHLLHEAIENIEKALDTIAYRQSVL